jgi:hypothetical protein
MPRWGTSSRVALRRAPSALISRTPIAWEFAATDSDKTIEPTDQQLSSSGDPAPARTGHRQAAPVVLEVSPFSLAERTASTQSLELFAKEIMPHFR